MLVLSRLKGGSVDLYMEPPGLGRVHLGRITVLRRTGEVVRLGFEMHTEIIVVRSELDLDNPPTKETVTQ